MRLVRLLMLLGLVLLLSCAEDESTKPDVKPPAPVTDLAVLDGAGDMITLTWTAPGDDGSAGRAARYDMRCAGSLASEADWSSATALVDSTRVPKPSGELESLAVGRLDDGTWQFALKAADEVPNWSLISNVASKTLIDTVAPGKVIDLSSSLATAETIRLTWTAPGDDEDRGSASAYDLRYARAPITAETWAAALQVEGLPEPGPSGAGETHSVTGLEQATSYSFALKAVDNAGNESELSNALSKSTARLVRLTTTSWFFPQYGAGRADWSPDGQRIVFVADWAERNLFTELYLMSSGGGHFERLTWEPDFAQYPSWAPDGTRLAFISERESNHSSILIMDAVPGALAAAVLTETSYQEQLEESNWSPDGSRIAYSVLERSTMPPYTILGCDIYAIDLLSGEPSLILRDTHWIKGLGWSPDGSQIVFSSARGGNYDIWVVPASGGSPAQLTCDPADDITPAWSPDGSRIAFASNRTGSNQIWLMLSTGEEILQITQGPAGKSRPAWSPDGNSILFDSYDDDIRDIWLLSWD